MKIRQGNDYNFSWTIYRINSEVSIVEGEIPSGAVIEDLSTAQNLKVTISHAFYPEVRYVVTPKVENNVLKFDVSASQQTKLGKYYVVVDFDKDDAALTDGLRHFRIDAEAYELVDKTANATLSNGLTISSLIVGGINGVNGLSAYQIAVKYGYTGAESEFVDWLRKPAVDAADTANTAASAANTAKTNADNATSSANAAATNANDKATLANTAATNANAAKDAANTAAAAANTAKTNADSAATAANAAAGSVNTAKDAANTAAAAANTAKTNADSAASSANSAATNANDKATLANTAATNANAAKDAANTAAAAANTAKTNADSAATAANSAAGSVNTAKDAANTAAAAANTAKTNADSAATAANSAATNANDKATLANTAATNANAAKDAANTASAAANTAKTNADNAASSANAAATNANDKATLANTAATNANAAKDAANTAASAANTAKTNADSAAAAANGQAGSYNVTVAIPLPAGNYYTNITARQSVPLGNRLLGRTITYATASGVWYTEKFIGTDIANWTTAENWEYVPRNYEFSQIPDNLEPALAEILNQQNARIKSLEELIKNMLFKIGQFDKLEVVKEFNIYGNTNMYVIKDTAPSITPDMIGQFYINTSGTGTIYQAKGNSSSADWKQISN